MQKYKTYRGIRLPPDVIDEIRAAETAWIRRDQAAWDFAKQAFAIVGRNIPGATRLLAKVMGVDDVSTPEGYAKAEGLAREFAQMQIGKFYPYPNLFISHYIVMGKAYYAQINKGEKSQKELLRWADELLKQASQFDWSVQKLRGKLSGKLPDDSWVNSANRFIESIETHIINAPQFDVPNPFRATIATKFATMFVKVLRWALVPADEDPKRDQVERDVENMLEISQDLFPVETGEKVTLIGDK